MAFTHWLSPWTPHIQGEGLVVDVIALASTGGWVLKERRDRLLQGMDDCRLATLFSSLSSSHRFIHKFLHGKFLVFISTQVPVLPVSVSKDSKDWRRERLAVDAMILFASIVSRFFHPFSLHSIDIVLVPGWMQLTIVLPRFVSTELVLLGRAF